MGRIRTIKPEFPHSESMGRVSRDARLTFILLWTLSDDSGRLRGSSRMLASLLFPYDDDAKDLIDAWLSELERESCIARYMIAGTSYLQVCNWSKHQKIDKPSGSKIPPPEEGSRILSNPREVSSGDQGSGKGSRIKDLLRRLRRQHARRPSLRLHGEPPTPNGFPTSNWLIRIARGIRDGVRRSKRRTPALPKAICPTNSWRAPPLLRLLRCHRKDRYRIRQAGRHVPRSGQTLPPAVGSPAYEGGRTPRTKHLGRA